MKVGVVVPGGFDRSGTHRVIPCLLWLVERLSRVHEVHVFSMRGEPEPSTHPLVGATVHHPGGAGGPTLATLRAVAAEHRRGPFALLHAFWASGPGVAAGVAGRGLRVPVLLHVTGGDLVGLPDIGYGGRATAWGRLRVRFALASAARRTAPSEALCAQARALGHPATRLPPGVDRAVWDAEPRPRDPGAPARLLHVGSLNAVKDQPVLLRALARLREAGVDATLDVVGEDTLDGRVQALAADLGLARAVRFHGFLPQDRLRSLVIGADLLLVSSRHEGDPVAMLEAAAAGVPTVGTAVGHVSDWAPEAAVAVPVGDHAALARETAALLADEPRRRRLAEAARARALAEDADWSAARVLELYEELAGGRVGRAAGGRVAARTAAPGS